MQTSKNSPIPAIAAVIVFAAAGYWLGWPGLVVAIASFLVGGLGTAYNGLVRHGLVLRKQKDRR